MHLQTALEDFDVFVRSLSIGAETMSMWFDPSQPMHDRYQVRHDFLSPELGDEIVTISRLVNAFFRWEFNSCETIVKDGVAYPIDYANASPDVALTSLHYYFPWAIKALVRWSRVLLGHAARDARSTRTRATTSTSAIDDELDYDEKLARYRELADDYFQVDAYHEFCERHLGHLDEIAHEWFTSPEFDDVLVETVSFDVPGPRARALRRALPRPARGVGGRHGLTAGRRRVRLAGRRLRSLRLSIHRQQGGP